MKDEHSELHDQEAAETWADRLEEKYANRLELQEDKYYMDVMDAFKAGAAHGRKAERVRAAKWAEDLANNLTAETEADEPTVEAQKETARTIAAGIRAGGEKE